MRHCFFLLLLIFSTTLGAGQPHFLLIGAPGSGKGTFTQYVQSQAEYMHIGMGDLLREEIAADSEVGRQVAALVEAGQMVPSEVMFSLFTARFEEGLAAGVGIIVDGMVQGEENVAFFDEFLDLHELKDRFVPLYLNVPREVAEDRLLGRLVCSDCGLTVNRADGSEESCQVCGGTLETRLDDSEETIHRRLERFYSKTLPLIDHYRNWDGFVEVDATQTLDELREIYHALLEKDGF